MTNEVHEPRRSVAEELRELKALCDNHITIARDLKDVTLLTLCATISSRLDNIIQEHTVVDQQSSS